MKKIMLLAFIGVFSLTVVSCNLLNSVQFNFAIPGDDSEQSQEMDDSQAWPNAAASQSDQCLANTWEMVGLSDYVAAAIPPALMAEYNLQYENTQGKAYLTFLPDGQVKLVADNVRIGFSAAAYIFSVPVTVRIDGTATGRFTTNGSTLTITEFDTQGLTTSAQALGEDLMQPDQIVKSIPFTAPPFNTADFTCNGDVLTLVFSGAPAGIPPLRFEAVK